MIPPVGANLLCPSGRHSKICLVGKRANYIGRQISTFQGVHKFRRKELDYRLNSLHGVLQLFTVQRLSFTPKGPNLGPLRRHETATGHSSQALL